MEIPIIRIEISVLAINNKGKSLWIKKKNKKTILVKTKTLKSPPRKKNLWSKRYFSLLALKKKENPHDIISKKIKINKKLTAFKQKIKVKKYKTNKTTTKI